MSHGNKTFKTKKEKCNELESLHNLKVKNLKACNVKIKNAAIQNLQAQTAGVSSLTTNSLNASVATINSLNVSTLNGSCYNPNQNINQNNNSTFIIVSNNQQPDNPGVNPSLWNALWNNAITQLTDPCYGLTARLNCGRLTERYYQDINDCTICPNQFPDCQPIPAPTGTTGPCLIPCNYIANTGDTGCFNIPGRILGIQTFPLLSLTACTGNTGTSLQSQAYSTKILSSVSYNLDVINNDPYLGVRCVSVMVQMAALGSQPNQINLTQIDFANKQFDFTLDTLYGEKFAANILLPSELTQEYAAQFGLAQIVIYIEEGISIQVLPTAQNELNQISQLAPSQISPRQTPNSQPISSQYLQYSSTYVLLHTVGGTYPVPPGKDINVEIRGGGGGGAIGNISTDGTPAGGGGGGGQGRQLYQFFSADAIAYIQVVQIGEGGLAGSATGNPNGGDGGETVINTLGSYGELFFTYRAQGGVGGMTGSNKNSGGAGGLSGTDGGGGGGAGGNPPGDGGYSQDYPGNAGSGLNGGNGGNDGGDGGKAVGQAAGGGGGGGYWFDLKTQASSGVPGGNGLQDGGNAPLGFDLMSGAGGGGGGGSTDARYAPAGGYGAPGYVLYWY